MLQNELNEGGSLSVFAHAFTELPQNVVWPGRLPYIKSMFRLFFTWFNFKYKTSEIKINLQNKEKLMYLLEWNELLYSVFTIS